MPTPREGYYLKDGTRVPGTTTVIGRFKESGAIVHWAWEQGKAGKDYRATKQSAADSGTMAHALVEASIKGEIAPTFPDAEPDVIARAVAAFGAYCTWASQSKLEILVTEPRLISEVHRFGGTLDAIGYLNGSLCLLDWKTSNAVYSDYLLQLAAYKVLWEENNPSDLITGGLHLCRFAKEHGDFAHHFYPNLDDAWEQFTLFRRAYDIDKGLRKRAA